MNIKRIDTCILCWCFCLSLTAQISTIDSLEQVLVSGKLKEPEKAVLLETLAVEYRYDTAMCRSYAREAIKLAHNIGSKRVEANSYNTLAYSYKYADSAKFRMYAMEALILAQNSGLDKDEGIACLYLGDYYREAGQFYLAHVHYKKAEKLFLKLNINNHVYISYQNLFILFNGIDDRDNSTYYLNKMLEIDVEQGNAERELSTQYYLGILRYEDSNGDEEALEYFLDLYQRAKLLKSGYTSNFAITCGEFYLRLNRPREGLFYLHEKREYVESRNLPAGVYSPIAEAYAMLHQVDSAEYYLKKAQEISLITKAAQLNLYRIRSLLEAEKGNYRNALESYKKYHQFSDSIAKAKRTTEIARMRNWHELEQKDNENILLQEERQKQHRLITILAGTLVLILALLSLSVYFYRQSIAKNRELKELHTVKDKLFSVIAHDLRSPMSSLTSMLELANNNMLDAETQAQLFREISMRVDDTHSLLDNLLRWSKSQMKGIAPSPTYFDVQNEIQTLMVNLQNIAASKQITLNNRIGNQEVFADRDMFAVVMRNLITNAIKYTSAEGEVTLSSELSDNMLVISVKDTGTGMSQEIRDSLFKLPETRSQRGTNNESGAGLGLVLCADFVKANGGSIWFASTQGKGSTFYFSIPVKRNENQE